MNYEVNEDSKEYLESIIVPVELKNNVKVFDGFVKSETNIGYIIGDLFFAKPAHEYPLIFKRTLIMRYDNAAECTYKIENIGEYTRRDNVEVYLEPVYYNGGQTINYPSGKEEVIPPYKVFSYFRIKEKRS